MFQTATVCGRGRTLAAARTGNQRCMRARVATPVAPPPPTQSQRSFDTQRRIEPDVVYGDEVVYSGLRGQALQTVSRWPSKQEVFAAIPAHCFKKDTVKSMGYAVTSLALTAACVTAGTFIPFSWAWAPMWAAYAGVTVMFLTFGWPVYLFTGASGGPIRGSTSHFDPRRGATGQNALFPGKFARKVWNSDIGIGAVVAGLVALGVATGNPAVPLLLYAAPLAVVNAWLIVYTWLHHTETDVPHFSGENWNWAKGAFMTIDRPYGPIANFLHHGIGSTHVVHHINHEIPHYHAWEASTAIQAKFPDIYLYDPTPIPAALWRVAQNCVAVEKKDGAAGAWVYTNGEGLKPEEHKAVAAPQLQP